MLLTDIVGGIDKERPTEQRYLCLTVSKGASTGVDGRIPVADNTSDSRQAASSSRDNCHLAVRNFLLA